MEGVTVYAIVDTFELNVCEMLASNYSELDSMIGDPAKLSTLCIHK